MKTHSYLMCALAMRFIRGFFVRQARMAFALHISSTVTQCALLKGSVEMQFKLVELSMIDRRRFEVHPHYTP